MPRVGFEPTIPVFERAKTVHALDRATTVLCIRLLCITYINWGRGLRYRPRVAVTVYAHIQEILPFDSRSGQQLSPPRISVFYSVIQE
jgi:hypothetical protein